MCNGGKQQSNVERKRDGKYWTRRDKYSPRHKCATQKLYNCKSEQEEESSKDSSDEENNENNKTPNLDPKEDMPQISPTAITG